MAVAALHGSLETMHTAFRQAGLLGQLANALGAMITKTLENPEAFVPKSHVGRFSEESLNSWWNSVLQRTRPTPHCPALSGYPHISKGGRCRSSGNNATGKKIGVLCSGSLSLCVNNSRTVSPLCNASESRECWCWEAIRPLHCPCNVVAYRQ